MSEVHWIKLKTEMFSDDKIRLIESMPEGDAILVIWIKLLIQAGTTNANGYIFLNENVPFTAEMLATLFNRPLTIVRLALNTLSDFDMISIDQRGKILIENWHKHQNIEGLDRIREQTRLRVAKHRENKKKLNVFKDVDTETDTEECVTVTLQVALQRKEMFECFRKKYPGTKRGLDTEFTYFQQKIKDWEEVINLLLPALDKQIKNHEFLSSQNKFVPNWKHLKTWIYNRSWEESENAADDQKQSVTKSIPVIKGDEPGWK